MSNDRIQYHRKDGDSWVDVAPDAIPEELKKEAESHTSREEEREINGARYRWFRSLNRPVGSAD